jgi:hypothetical protein
MYCYLELSTITADPVWGDDVRDRCNSRLSSSCCIWGIDINHKLRGKLFSGVFGCALTLLVMLKVLEGCFIIRQIPECTLPPFNLQPNSSTITIYKLSYYFYFYFPLFPYLARIIIYYWEVEGWKKFDWLKLMFMK